MSENRQHVNSQNELIGIKRLPHGAFKGQHVLIVYDDPTPRGSGIAAPMLLDRSTRNWLRAECDRIDLLEEQEASESMDYSQ